MKHYLFFPQLITLVFSLLTLSTGIAFASPGVQRVAILPFATHADHDLSYLSSGIRDMLASRLSSGAEVEIVPRANVNQALAGKPAPNEANALRKLGTELQADYILSGSLTSLAGSLSLDSTLYSVKGDQPKTFFSTAPREEEIISAIDALSWQIAEQAFGKQKPATSAVAAIPASGSDPYQSTHPDRLLMGGGSGSSSAILRPLGVVTGALGFTKSQNFNYGLVAMEIGDVDADGQDEYVLASPYDIRIYRKFDNRFQKIGQVTLPRRYSIHGVTMADLNNNGRQEIYISAADAKDPSSLVLEWDGKDFSHLADNVSWYLRVIDIPGKGNVLAGQKSGLNTPIAKGVYLVDLSNSQVIKGDQLQTAGFNLFDFSLADLDGNGSLEVIGVSQKDVLLVATQAGKILWSSDDYFGGTTRFVGGDSPEDMNKDLEYGNNEGKRIYIPSRIVIKDMNNDGLPDVVVNKNLSSASRILSRVKSYPSGEIHCLTWNGISLTELWRTRKIDGYISDYQLGKVKAEESKDGKGQIIEAELNVGVVLNSGGLNFVSNADSAVLTFPLQLTGEEGK